MNLPSWFGNMSPLPKSLGDQFMSVWFKMASKANLPALLPTSPQHPIQVWPGVGCPLVAKVNSLQISKFWVERPGRCVHVGLEGSQVSSPAQAACCSSAVRSSGVPTAWPPRRACGQPCMSSSQSLWPGPGCASTAAAPGGGSPCPRQRREGSREGVAFISHECPVVQIQRAGLF